MNSIRLCLVLHNHQPVGNFGGVFEQAYQDSYRLFLDVFEQYDLPIALHTSGPLMEWLDERHPEYVDRLARLVAAGRIEVIGGPFYEPILTMIPPRDRVGQIANYSQWLESRLGGKVQGMWMPERVWEQSLTADLAAAGIRYTVLDDFHFKNAGLVEEQLHGYYLTEDDGRLLSIFPGSEPLRYTIPFQQPQATIDYLRQIAARRAGAVVVFGDDGEKFGVWPETKKHVYDNGWLRQFFDALVANREWLHLTTLAEATANVPPEGKIYLPDCSYREMTEWALPVPQQIEYDHLVHEMERDDRWPRLKRFFQGGFWRNFRVKYPEANEMYARMMMASRRLEQVDQQGAGGDDLRYARQALYRGQCNCPYWHGAFGGIYLPHLRNAIYNQLIACDNLLDKATGKTGGFVEATVDDYNFDARQEIRLANDKLIGLFAPAAGGMLYELDVRTICHNLLATLARRPEAYHRKVLAGASNNGNCASIHDRVVFKQAGLEQRLQYDRFPRKSLLDHFYEPAASLAAASRGEAHEQGDFVQGIYETKIRKSADRIQVQLTRLGRAGQHEVRITKGITLVAGSPKLEVAYLLENLPLSEPLHFAIELNLSGLPAGADDRYFHDGQGRRLGQLGKQLDLSDAQNLNLVDEWLGIDVGLAFNRPTGLWAFPVETVSQSEGGFELVHQSVCVQPHWLIRPDASGRWSVTFTLTASTALAEQRMRPAPQAQPELVGSAT
ncbi:MAG TPA: alpha-amylase/4-alpha-glucanotransferase domain-containing protein [Pirellulaceae bacterium]|nr:alpha-amylase/4-alpha-glucanotransferase domain-containing protein [Pirellulaceae bacterium]